MKNYRQLLPYGIAIGATAIALLLSLGLEMLLAHTVGAVFYISIIISSWYGGWRSGIVTVIFSGLASNYFLISPIHGLQIAQAGDVLELEIFLVVGLTINLLTNYFRQSTQKIKQQLQEISDRLSKTIIQQQQAQQMLELQAVITRNMAEGVCLVSASDALIVYANPKFEQMFGYDYGELNGQHVSIINYANNPEMAEQVNQAICSAVLQQGEATYEVHNVKKDGTPFWCSATTSVFQHPEYGYVLVAVQQDITARKQIEDALRESEEKFRQLADNIQAVFWMTDIDYKQLLYVSKAYESIWQHSCAELYENVSAWLEAVHPEDRDRVQMEMVEQLKAGNFEKKYRIIRPDGSIRWIRDRSFAIKNELGEIIRLAGLAEDITEEEKIEQMKSEFIGIVSHELRTPLTSIRASMGLLQSGIYDQKPEKFQRMIDIAASESDRLVRLVNDILDLERLDSGRVVLKRSICTAADLIEQAVAGVQAIAKQQNIAFNIQSTDIKVWVAADALIQTLTNLLSNALKFSPADSTITISVEQQTNKVLFSISDRGRGIPADKLETIFQRFQQVDVSDSRLKGGTGLGLAICRTIIDQHGGKIWAESTLGVGSTFFFTLPIVEAEEVEDKGDKGDK